MKMTIGGGEGLETLLVNIALCIVIVIGNQNKNELTLKMNLIGLTSGVPEWPAFLNPDFSTNTFIHTTHLDNFDYDKILKKCL